MKNRLMNIMQRKLNDRGLEFKLTRECSDKLFGSLVDIKTKVEMPFTVDKELQLGEFGNFANYARHRMNLYIELEKVR